MSPPVLVVQYPRPNLGQKKSPLPHITVEENFQPAQPNRLCLSERGTRLRLRKLNRRFAASHAVAALLCAVLCPLAVAQRYPILPVPGSPKNVRVLFQDSRGRLWLGGDRLSCFDGTRFFFLSDYGFPAVTTSSISEDATGAIWIGAETGVYRFDGRVEEVAKGVVTSLIAVKPGLVLASMGPVGRGVPESASLVRIQQSQNKWTTQTMTSLGSPGPLTLDHSGMLLYPAGTGWNELPLQQAINRPPGSALSIQTHLVGNPNTPGAGPRKVLRDKSGCVWFGNEGGSAYNCDGKNWRNVNLPGLGSELNEAQDGSVILSGYNRLAVGRPESFRTLATENGLPLLFTALQARDGTIWLGGADGLFRFASPFEMEYWTATEGVRAPWCVQRLGTRIYACMDHGVGELSQDHQSWKTIASFQSTSKVMGLLAPGRTTLTDDNTLVAALNPGFAALVRTDGKILTKALPGDWEGYGLRLARTHQDVWFGGLALGRLKRVGDGLGIDLHKLETQPSGNVLAVQYEEHTHKLWACYNGGLASRNDDNNWREFTTKDGLLVNPCWSLAALPNGDVWYGYYLTPAFALIRPGVDGRVSVRQYKASDDIRDPESLTFDSDSRGWLWRGGNKGLSVATTEQAENGQWLFLDQSDGLSGEGVNSGGFFADSDQSVWFGCDLTIFHYTPAADLLKPSVAPQLFLSALSLNGALGKMQETITRIPHGATVVAHLGSLQFSRRNALRVRYRLMPDQPDWKTTSSLDLPLNSPSSGTHVLEVQARLLAGPWSKTRSWPVVVARSVWLTAPLLATYVIVAGILLSSVYLLQRRRALEKAQVLPDLKSWRMGAFLPDFRELVGSLLDDRFEINTMLARGGFANVMEGYDHQQKRRCAIKVFRNEVSDADWVQRRFQQEITALQRVRHPNVVSIYASGSTPFGAPYLVMEFLEGKNLREVLDSGALSHRRASRMLHQLSDAIGAIHAQGIWHRDIKPDNVIVRNAGLISEEAILIDFSIAIVKDANETLYGLSRAAGSFDYMAPEQAIGYAEASSDIYSFAKLTIEMLTGRRLSQLLPNASINLPEDVQAFLPEQHLGLSEESIRMLAAALEFDPSRRPRNVNSFIRPILRDLELVAATEA